MNAKLPTKPEFLLTEDELGAWLGYERRSDIERWLVAHDVMWGTAKASKIVTSRKAVEDAFARESTQAVSF